MILSELKTVSHAEGGTWKTRKGHLRVLKINVHCGVINSVIQLMFCKSISEEKLDLHKETGQ